MSEKKKNRVFDYGHEISQIRELQSSFLGLFDPQLRDWETYVGASGTDTEKKMANRLTSTRFTVLDSINDLTKKIQADMGFGKNKNS